MYAIPALFLLVQLLLPVSAFAGDGAAQPEINPEYVVLEYHKAFRRMDWTLAARHSHPQFLKAFKEKILAILGQTEKKGQIELLGDFGVAEIGDLEAMSPVDFYTAANRRRWRRLSARHKEDVQQAGIKILSTKHLDDDRCIVRFHSQVSAEDRPVEKEYRYLIRRHHGKWKVDLSDHVVAAEKK